MTDVSWNITDTVAEPEKKQPPLWKQLRGAGVGMLVALALYNGYKFAAPAVTAYLVPPGGFAASALEGEASFSDKGANQKEDAFDRVGSRIRQQAAAALAARPDADPNAPAPRAPEIANDMLAFMQNEELTTLQLMPKYVNPTTEETLATLRPIINGTDATRSGAPAENIGKGDDGKGKGKPGPIPGPTPTPAPNLPDSGPSFWLLCLLALGGAICTPALRERLLRMA